MRLLRLRPSTLLARTTATLAVSALAILGMAYLALDRYVIAPITDLSADDQAALVVLSAQTWVELPPEARPYFELELAQNHDLIIGLGTLDLEPADLADAYVGLVQQKLSDRVGSPVPLWVEADLVWAGVPMGGYQVQVGFEVNRREIEPLYVGIVILLIGAVIVFLTSLAIVRRIARPLVQVADRAESFRGAEDFDPLPEQGPRELVTLARSFNTMAKEVASLLSNRTTLLVGISHDLRTPLARLRLLLALLPDNVDRNVVERFERNLEAMDELIGDTLRFARGTREEAVPVPFTPFLRNVVDGQDDTIDLVSDVGDELVVRLAPGAFKRIMLNLIDNAQRHADSVSVWTELTQDALIVHVRDSGPGIPADSREQIFQPFFRLEASRSRTTGGSGLGLAIVHQLCQAHGWRVAVVDNAGGGADFQVTVPLQSGGAHAFASAPLDGASQADGESPAPGGSGVPNGSSVDNAG